MGGEVVGGRASSESAALLRDEGGVESRAHGDPQTRSTAPPKGVRRWAERKKRERVAEWNAPGTVVSERGGGGSGWWSGREEKA